ncbi:MAG: sugar isomerase [Deltaproteobacteria bacterium]|nr:sugar isomerase [Deltaproteobacteria bacterium]
MKTEKETQDAYGANSRQVMTEIDAVLSRVTPSEVETLVQEIMSAEKVFVVAVGRVFLALQCFCKRLVHLGINANIVGAVNEGAFTEKDLLLVASGSGESVFPKVIAEKAVKLKGRIGLITSAESSTIKSMAHFAVHLPCPTKNDKNRGVISIQPMSTLFDQALHIFGDIVSLSIQNRKHIPKDELWRFHANLE